MKETPRAGLETAQKWAYSRLKDVARSLTGIRGTGLVILFSDELDFSAARWPPELILGSMSTEHTIYGSCKHKNNTPRVGLQTLFTLQTLALHSNSNSNRYTVTANSHQGYL